MKRRLATMRSSAPVIVFDPKHEYPAPGATDEQSFVANVNRMADHHAPVKWAILRPTFEQEKRVRQFDRFCKIALAIARTKGECIVVVDELHLVTDSSRGKVPDGWLELVNTGRAYGVHILAASIRPQSIDMDFRSNLTSIRAGRLGERADCERVASKLMIDWREIASLPNLDYIERDLRLGSPAQRGRITF
jgi:hypothetical protein